MIDEYDYIVVGGGSAGCVLAARLSEDPSVDVLLVERGDAYSRLRLGIPLLGKRNSARFLEIHRTRGQAHCSNRSIDLPVANAMGGGSSVNAMMYVRGERRAYDRWAEQGAAGWDYAGVLPYFRKLEDFEDGASEYHGQGGPIGVSSSRYRSRFGESFIDACVERGLDRNDDFTGAAQGGAGFYQFTQSNGERASTALAYLRPAIRRANLRVCSNTTVDRIVVEHERASGVRGRRLAHEFQAQARREVILAAGALSTPKIMMLSGLGPADELAALGIEPRVNLPGVGRGLQDHPRFPVVFQPKQPVRISVPALAAAFPRWLVTRRGMLASPLIDAGAFLRVADASELLDCQLVVQWAGGAAERNAIHVNPCLIDVESRGTVTLRSADPDARPIVDPNYLATERERNVAVKALRFIRSLGETKALGKFGLAGEILPGDGISSDDQILEYVRNHVETAYHPAGTCRMGVDEHSVVDPHLKVHGVHGLRIADASVMPSLINGNTNGPTTMIAEKAADLIVRAADGNASRGVYTCAPSRIRGKRPMARQDDPDLERWNREVLARSLKKSPERRKDFATSSAIPVERVYTPSDRGREGAGESLGLPGEYPFTRGVQPTMYRSRLWTMRQYSGFGTAAETNARFRYLLEQGQTGLSVAFDLPTQMGYDSDHPMAVGEVGKVGVAISSIEDMEELLGAIPLDQVSTSMTINATASILLALYVTVAERRGVAPAAVSGTIQNDLLKEYIARGTYIYPPEPSLRITTDIFAWCAKTTPRWNTISISGYHMREAGATAVQEVAFTLANAIAYCEAAVAAGLSFETFGPRLSFFFNGHSNFFEEAAKFRAARRLWARIVRERFGVSDPELGKLRFHTQTAGSTLTAQQPEVNVVRTALQALSAVLGGTQSLHTNAMDEALGLPTEAAALLALRTQQVIAHETGVADTVDPLAGSYFVESLTDAIEAGARSYLERIDRMGGAVRAIEKGFQQREIHDAAYRWQKDVERGDAVVVGVNRFTEGESLRPPILKIDPAIEKSRRERLHALRARRAASAVASSLGGVEEAARSGANLMPAIVAAVAAEATLGEISDRMRAVFGIYHESPAF